eukprot:9486813-Alexandrium_andersonii.AAC.1
MLLALLLHAAVVIRHATLAHLQGAASAQRALAVAGVQRKRNHDTLSHRTGAASTKRGLTAGGTGLTAFR